MPEKRTHQPYEAAATAYMNAHSVSMDNTSLATGRLNPVFDDIQAQVLGTQPATTAEVDAIVLKPENLQPAEFTRSQQAVRLVFAQLHRGYDRIRANRQNPQFSLKTSPVTQRTEMERFTNNFLPKARRQVLDILSSQSGQWYVSQEARRRLAQSLNFAEEVLLGIMREGRINAPILRELNRYPGIVARDLALAVPDRSRLGLSQPVGDPTLFGLQDILPDEYRRRSVTRQTGAPAPAEEKGTFGKGDDKPRSPGQIPRQPKP